MKIGAHVSTSGGPAWRRKRVILTIGAADFFTDCWCNGIHLGHHEGGYLPFEFDLTDTLAELGQLRPLVVPGCLPAVIFRSTAEKTHTLATIRTRREVSSPRGAAQCGLP